MKNLTTFVLILMLLSIAYAVTFCTPEYKYYYMTATAYCPCETCCGEWADGFTYTGDIAGKGCVAIDPKNGPLKLRQRVYIAGYGEGVCNDIGEAIKHYDVDLCYDTHREALERGVKLIKVYVIK